MSQQTVDPKASETENGEPKQQPVAKKTPLRDLPNENNILVNKSTGNSMISKEGDNECPKNAGTKRPCPDSPANSVNGHLVYVRRKAETESGTKNIADETPPDNSANSSQSRPDNGANSSQSKQAVTQPPQQDKPQPKEPIPGVSSVNLSSGKPSVPHPVMSAAPSDRKRVSNQNWEERYVQLQMFLKKLEHSCLDEYLEKLRALPAAELSRHAVDLENRSIQLSLEEGIELKRVKALDVLGKSKNMKTATVQIDPPQSVQRA